MISRSTTLDVWIDRCHRIYWLQCLCTPDEPGEIRGKTSEWCLLLYHEQEEQEQQKTVILPGDCG